MTSFKLILKIHTNSINYNAVNCRTCSYSLSQRFETRSKLAVLQKNSSVTFPFLQANVEVVLALDKNFKIFCLRPFLKFIV